MSAKMEHSIRVVARGHGFVLRRSPAMVFLCLAVLASMLTGCGPLRIISALLPGPTSPTQAAWQATSGGSIAGSFKIWGTRLWPGGAVVLYTRRQPGTVSASPIQWFGDVMVRQDGSHWRPANSSEGGTTATPVGLVDYGSGSGNSDTTGPYSMVYGRVLTAGKRAGVATVDAVFANGQKLHDQASNGIFVLITPHATTVCRFQVRDTHGHVLQRYDLADSIVPGKGPVGPSGCRQSR